MNFYNILLNITTIQNIAFFVKFPGIFFKKRIENFSNENTIQASLAFMSRGNFKTPEGILTSRILTRKNDTSAAALVTHKDPSSGDIFLIKYLRNKNLHLPLSTKLPYYMQSRVYYVDRQQQVKEIRD